MLIDRVQPPLGRHPAKTPSCEAITRSDRIVKSSLVFK
jgi:hypothetical protein